MDIQLKGQREGIDAAREIRDRFDVPVVYLTAHADPETLKQASLTRPFAYLLKPVDDRELAAAIEAALANHAAEKRLRETERWLSATLRSIDDGVLTADRNLRVRFLNRVAEELTGWKVAEAVGQNVLDVFQLDREGTPIAARDLVAEAREDGPIVGRRKAARLVAKDGRQTFITHSVSPILDDRSQSTGFVLVFRDVTEHEDAEREIRAQGEALDTANRQLRQQVERLQLAEQQLIQAQKMEALGRLAGGVAHDFNNLLTVIAGYNSMMLEEQLSPDGAEGAREIAGAVERAAALTKQLLAFGRHKMRSPAPLDLNEVVCQIEKMLRRIIGENVKLVTKLAPGVAKVYVDAGQIDQVILNLAVNARDAMPDGGALTIETAEVEFGGESTDMRIGAPPGQYVMLAITDTGTGMGVEVQKRMFEPFFTTKEAGKGTGLGLSIVHGIVSQSGGKSPSSACPATVRSSESFFPSCETAKSLRRRRLGNRARPPREPRQFWLRKMKRRYGVWFRALSGGRAIR
jgi:hypothetical protein